MSKETKENKPSPAISASQVSEMLESIERRMVAIDRTCKDAYAYEEKLGFWKLVDKDDWAQALAKELRKDGVSYGGLRTIEAGIELFLIQQDKVPERAKGYVNFEHGLINTETGMNEFHNPELGVRRPPLKTPAPMINGDGTPKTLEQVAPTSAKFLRDLLVVKNEDGTEGPDYREKVLAGMYITLIGDLKHQRVFEVVGVAGSGKSTLANLMMEMIGGKEYVASVGSFTEFDREVQSDVVRASLVIIPDQPFVSGMGSGIKKFTGEDLIRVNDKHKAQYSAVPAGVLWSFANQPAVFTDGSEGVARRLVSVRCENKPKRRDYDMPERLRNELPELTSWIIERFRNKSREEIGAIFDEWLITKSEVEDRAARNPVLHIAENLEVSAEETMTRGGKNDDPRGSARVKTFGQLMNLHYEIEGGKGLKEMSMNTFMNRLRIAFMELHGVELPRRKTNAGYVFLVKVKESAYQQNEMAAMRWRKRIDPEVERMEIRSPAPSDAIKYPRRR